MSLLPPLVDKALVDAGFDLALPEQGGWVKMAVSGNREAVLWVRAVGDGTLLATLEPTAAERVGLEPLAGGPAGSGSVGLARSAQDLYRALRLLKTLALRPAARLSAEVEARLAHIPVTERTREVRQRIGQDVFREALVEFWDGRCALTGARLPNELLRASHAKPWADASDDERLDPFNGLLLAVRYDALFDKGLIAFADDGWLLVSADVTLDVREFVGLRDSMQLRFVLPGHVPYLKYHREHVA